MKSWDIRKKIEECDEQIARVDAHMVAMQQEFKRLSDERSGLEGRRVAYTTILTHMEEEEKTAQDTRDDDGSPEFAE